MFTSVKTLDFIHMTSENYKLKLKDKLGSTSKLIFPTYVYSGLHLYRMESTSMCYDIHNANDLSNERNRIIFISSLYCVFLRLSLWKITVGYSDRDIAMILNRGSFSAEMKVVGMLETSDVLLEFQEII